MIYDDVLDVTWLQDANYAHTSGYDDPYWVEGGGLDEGDMPSGEFSADGGNVWADQLVWGGMMIGGCPLSELHSAPGTMSPRVN